MKVHNDKFGPSSLKDIKKVLFDLLKNDMEGLCEGVTPVANCYE